MTNLGSIPTQKSREKPSWSCQFGYAFCVTFGTAHKLPARYSSHERQADRVFLEALIWTNRFLEWQIKTNETAPTQRCLLPIPSDRRFSFLLRVAQQSKIGCLSDVYTATGWPAEDVFAQRIMLNFVAAGEPPPVTVPFPALPSALTSQPSSKCTTDANKFVKRTIAMGCSDADVVQTIFL